ncbi:hypothetical protein [Amycolatopsis rubida]|uniref:hypothetical protein n=1 Tax=Amycolatopsis rubida TaxID=112413 RepID=UPI001926D221|nr:hypothetical protein [Amycolatopsis rubida]
MLREFLRHGTTAARSHVDVDLGLGLRGIEIVREAAQRLGGAVEVGIVAFPQDGVLRRPGVRKLLDEAAAAGAGRIGGLDPAGIDRDPVGQLDGLFEIAERRGVGLDIHLHDGGELGAFQCVLIEDRTVRTGLQGKVTVSHGFALGEVPPARQAALLDRITEAGISLATVAPVRVAPLPWLEFIGARGPGRARHGRDPRPVVPVRRRRHPADRARFRPPARLAEGRGSDGGGGAGDAAGGLVRGPGAA